MKTIEKMESFYLELKSLHDDCLKDLYCYAKTDLRLTSSTNDWNMSKNQYLVDIL